MACAKPYNPSGIKNVTGYLVVEGIINTGNDSTKIQLSRTVTLNSATVANPVTGAQFVIQGNDNSTYALTGDSAAIYSSGPLNLDNNKQYRIDIKTTDGNEYQSGYVPVKVTPLIDSISPVIESNGLAININTHDPNNNTRYYRWDYTETWEFHAEYFSSYFSNGDSILYRQPSQQIYYCYSNDNSTNILLGSSAKLTQDVISSAPIIFILSTSEKIETEYSIIVHQYALTGDAYNYWANLKTNTEQLGSIFDALPSEINGNIHCITNPVIPVIGYISASTIQSKRIFVYNSSLPTSWVTTYPYSCQLYDFVLAYQEGSTIVNEVNAYLNYKKGAVEGEWVPVEPIEDKLGNILGYTGADRECADCSIRGSLIKPSFF
jgi:hypothetical protein